MNKARFVKRKIQAVLASLAGFVANTLYFKCPQRKKSRGIKSSD